ncbi:chymotrypsin-1-like [Chironomus tepperi]|uniref:chymotrypsin-1-like n=1 Tax=Chironomus tepperi TaxID=113505 RepID=UPI00391F49CD
MKVLLLVPILFLSVPSCYGNFLNGFFTRPNAVNSNQCQPSGNGTQRIVGGEESPVHYPYQISLQMSSRGGGAGLFFFLQPKSNWSHFCGGSVLNEDYIVTAAHCIKGFNTSKMSVLAGTNDLRKENEGSRHLIDGCVIHPEYVELNNSDVAVCKLKTPFVFNDNIAPIALDKTYVEKEECLLTGWGYRSMIRGMSLPTNKLHRIKLPTITNQECNEKGMKVGPREVCTFSRFGQGACGGDSGKSITSFSINCSQNN